jgi:hypothetical protein
MGDREEEEWAKILQLIPRRFKTIVLAEYLKNRVVL